MPSPTLGSVLDFGVSTALLCIQLVSHAPRLAAQFSTEINEVVVEVAVSDLPLGIWDLRANGGNSDGVISYDDRAVQLGIAPGGIVLWIDENHDGIAQPAEISTFADKGVVSIDVGEYRTSPWADKEGNSFRYSAPVLFSDEHSEPSFEVHLKIGEAIAPE